MDFFRILLCRTMFERRYLTYISHMWKINLTLKAWMSLMSSGRSKFKKHTPQKEPTGLKYQWFIRNIWDFLCSLSLFFALSLQASTFFYEFFSIYHNVRVNECNQITDRKNCRTDKVLHTLSVHGLQMWKNIHTNFECEHLKALTISITDRTHINDMLHFSPY